MLVVLVVVLIVTGCISIGAGAGELSGCTMFMSLVTEML